ncbi:glycosyltransferase family 2 protein [Streptomyces genisteinicus]|uniref:glycosyltransferase family 2 protein n=1 Tax=Streptomyces genisteinicus TaxID=2768068 RepID=UPI001FEA9307|nr:glycosyltransferase family 2 protein [Streptomyces genisteinicus]
MSVKVSVVIPVYNPGKYLDPCIESLLGQTMPPEEFEVLFVDDGSTDDTPARLDGLASRHPHFRVIHIPNSGWPGKPRNIGVEAAAGEYVQFLDQDDHLGTDALRRLWAMGHRNGSDIVIGKVASNFRGVPHGVFRKNRERCTLRNAPLFDSLTPHKMFRTAFLREHGIAYPEGKRRLEDQLYMMKAYIPAEVVSILGTYTCYHYSKRDDGKNAGSAKLVPEGYYGNLREVLDVVVEGTGPGPLRDRVLRRFYRVEMLGRLSEPAVLTYDDAFLRAMTDAIRPLALEFMGGSVHGGLGPMLRLRSELLRADDAEGLVRLARFAASVKGAVRLEDLAWQPDGRIAVRIGARLVHGEDREPLTMVRRDGRLYLDPAVTDRFLPAGELVDVTDDLRGFTAELSLRDRETAVEWPCPASFTAEVTDRPDGTCEVVMRGTGHLATEGGRKGRGSLPRGFWDAWVTVRGLGVVRRARLGADRAEHVADRCMPALLSGEPRSVIPYFTDPHGNLTLDVARRGKRTAAYLRGRTVLRMPGTPVRLRLDLFTTGGTAPGTGAGSGAPELVLTKPSDDSDLAEATVVHSAACTLRPALDRAHLELPRRLPGAPEGTWRLSVRLDGDTGPLLPLCTADVDGSGRLRLDGSLPVPDPVLLRQLVTERRRVAARRAVRSVVGPVVRRLPAPARKRARRLAARVFG